MMFNSIIRPAFDLEDFVPFCRSLCLLALLALPSISQAASTITAQSLVKPLTATAQALTSTAKASPAAAKPLSGTAQALTGTAKALSGTAQALTGTASSLPHRYPALAETLAWLPGIALHGSGHIYAGSYFKGFSLLALEGASIWLGYSNSMTLADDVKSLSNSGSNGKIPSNLAPITSRVGIVSVALFGFIDTWLDDVGGAGIAADKFNQRQALEASRVALAPTPDGQCVLLGYSARF